MSSVRHILVPTSFSPASEAACSTALQLAVDLGAHVTLLHIVDVPVPPFSDDENLPSPDYVAPALRAARAALEAVRRRMGRNCTIRAVLRLESTATEILGASAACNADLIVMGTHRKPQSLSDWLAGTTEKVVRRAHVPVLTVHAQPNLT